jgi:hypothetical protein
MIDLSFELALASGRQLKPGGEKGAMKPSSSNAG